MSTLTAFPFIQERSEATPGLWNYPLSIISGNVAAVDSTLLAGHFQQLSIGSTPPSYLTTAAVTIEVNSAYSDYLYLVDSSAQKSSYIIGSRAGGLADGLNIWDASAGTLIASFSKQSIRFFQNVVGPVFDVGGALAATYNAATFGGSTKTVQIGAAISQAVIDAVPRVYIPASMYPYNPTGVPFSTAVQMVREGGDWSVYDVWAYGAKGLGFDAQSAQAAINGAAANKGTVHFPPGTYNIGSSLTAINATDLQIRGTGINSALISMSASGVTLLRFTGVCSRIIIRDLWLGSFVSYAAGGSLEVTGTVGTHSDSFLVENVMCQNTPQPIYLQYMDQSNFNNVRTKSSISSCIKGYGLYLNNVISTHFREFYGGYASAVSYPKDLVVVGDDCDTITFTNSQALGAIGYGFKYENVAGGTGPRLCRLTNTYSESHTSGGYLVSACRDVHWDNCEAAANGGPGYKITGGDGIEIYGSLAYQNNEDGFIVSATGGPRGVSIENCIATNNGQTANNTYDGIAIGSGTSGIRLALNRCGDVFLSLANKQRYGISIATSTDYLTLVDNDLIGNQTAGLLSTSTGGNNLMFDRSVLTTTSTGTLYFPGLVLGADPGNGGETFRMTGHSRTVGYLLTQGSNAQVRFDNRTSSNSSQLYIYNQIGTEFRFANVQTNHDWMFLGGTVESALSLTPASSTTTLDLGSANRPWNRLLTVSGSSIIPVLAYGSDQSLGLYSSGAQTIAQSYGTLNLATNAVRLSMRTLAASAVTASAANTNVAVNEVVVTVQASGASFAVNSGGTTWIFSSVASAKNT